MREFQKILLVGRAVMLPFTSDKPTINSPLPLKMGGLRDHGQREKTLKHINNES